MGSEWCSIGRLRDRLAAQWGFWWVHRAPGGGEGHTFTGVYREITPPERLVFTVRSFTNGVDPIGTVIFSEAGARTTLTLTIACATAKDRDAMLQMRIDQGTVQTLDNLAAHLHERI